MKGSTWRKLAREYLLPYLPDCQLAGTILVFGQVEWILHGLAIDTSAFSATSVAVSMFTQPLYVPIEHVWGDYGERLRQPKTNFEWWDIEPRNEAIQLRDMLRIIQEQALPFYGRTATPQGLVNYSEGRYRNSVNPPIIEAEAYSWALVGQDKKAIEALDRLQRAVEAMPPTQPWGQPILARSLLVRQALAKSDPAVTHLLQEWRDETVRRLKLEKLAARQ